MKPQELIDAFGGTQMSAAKALNRGQATVSDWFRKGEVPIDVQIEAEVLSKGKIKADLPKTVRERAA